MSPIPSPVLILRNSGPALRRGHGLPALERAHRASHDMPPARQADLRPLPRLVGFATADAQPQPVGHDGDVFDIERHQFGATQCTDEAEQQQRPVTPPADALVAGDENLPQHGQGQGGSLPGGAAVGA